MDRDAKEGMSRTDTCEIEGSPWSLCHDGLKKRATSGQYSRLLSSLLLLLQGKTSTKPNAVNEYSATMCPGARENYARPKFGDLQFASENARHSVYLAQVVNKSSSSD